MASRALRARIAATRPKAKPAGGSRVPRAPAGPELDYLRSMRGMMKAVGRSIDPELDAIANDNGVRVDAKSGSAAALRARVQRIISQHVQIASRAAGAVNASNLTEMQRVLGMDRRALLPDASLDQWTRENVELITSIGDELADQVEEVVSGALSSGMRVETLRARLQERFQVAESRAALIARDQILKANAQLTQARMRHVGVSRYVWRCTHDYRTRQAHKALDGKTFSFSEPPIVDPRTGRRANPGEDFQCRCQAEPVFEEDEEETTEAPVPTLEPSPTRVPTPPPAPRQPPRIVARGQVEIPSHPREVVAPLSDALQAPTVGADGHRHYSPAARDEMRRIVQSAHPELRSTALEIGRQQRDRLVASSALKDRGVYKKGNGEIVINDEVMNDANRGFSALARGEVPAARSPAAQGMRTVIHETLHEHSPTTSLSYVGRGAVIEEVTTELLARDTLRQLGVYDPSNLVSLGAYQREIDRLVRVTQEFVPGGATATRAEAAEMMVTAAIRMRSSDDMILDEDAYVRAFAEALGVPHSRRASFREAIGEL